MHRITLLLLTLLLACAATYGQNIVQNQVRVSVQGGDSGYYRSYPTRVTPLSDTGAYRRVTPLESYSESYYYESDRSSRRNRRSYRSERYERSYRSNGLYDSNGSYSVPVPYNGGNGSYASYQSGNGYWQRTTRTRRSRRR